MEVGITTSPFPALYTSEEAQILASYLSDNLRPNLSVYPRPSKRLEMGDLFIVEETLVRCSFYVGGRGIGLSRAAYAAKISWSDRAWPSYFVSDHCARRYPADIIQGVHWLDPDLASAPAPPPERIRQSDVVKSVWGYTSADPSIFEPEEVPSNDILCFRFMEDDPYAAVTCVAAFANDLDILITGLLIAEKGGADVTEISYIKRRKKVRCLLPIVQNVLDELGPHAVASTAHVIIKSRYLTKYS